MPLLIPVETTRKGENLNESDRSVRTWFPGLPCLQYPIEHDLRINVHTIASERSHDAHEQHASVAYTPADHLSEPSDAKHLPNDHRWPIRSGDGSCRVTLARRHIEAAIVRQRDVGGSVESPLKDAGRAAILEIDRDLSAEPEVAAG